MGLGYPHRRVSTVEPHSTLIHPQRTFHFRRQKIVNPTLRTLVTCALSIYFVTIVLIADIVLSQNDDRFPSVHSILLLKNSSKIA